MNTASSSVVTRMESLIARWEPEQDRRAIFLSCYAMMTANMIRGIERGEFEDAHWVGDLMLRFAEYYFNAQIAYEQQASVPLVWQYAFDAAKRPETHVLQNLILGVNAHITYDLVFVLYDILRDGWVRMSPDEQTRCYRDHCRVNDVIYRTIDAVQDEVVERYSPQMILIDDVAFRLDEWVLQRLIARWREQVWTNASRLIACCEDDAPAMRRRVEEGALMRSRAIMLEYGVFGLRYLF